jgi:chromosome segregation ATPase
MAVQSRPRSPERPPDHPGEVEALRSLVESVRDQVVKAEALATEARGDLRAERERVDALRAQLDKARGELDALSAELEVAHQAAAADQTKIATLTAEATLDALRAERAAWSTLRRLGWAITGRQRS